MERTRIRTKFAPAAIGPYSQGILVDNTLYLSGQIAIDPETGDMRADSLEIETEQVLSNLGAVLRAAGMNFKDVVQCTVYMIDIDDYGAINEIYARYFSEMPPARETVQVTALPRNARVEISCIAIQ